MKIELVFIPSPGVGHIRSTTALAKLLVDSDDRLSVTLIVIPPQFSDKSSSSVYPKSQNRLRYHLLLADRDQSTKLNFISYIESQKPNVKAAVSELVTRSCSRLAGIVVDMFCTSMMDIADELNLPAYIFYTSGASYLGLQFHVQTLYEEKKLDVSELKNSDVKFDVPTLTQPFPANCLPSVMLSKEWFPYVLRRARSLRATKGILVNSVAEMEPQASKFFSDGNGNTPPVYAVGPILDFKTDGDDEKRREILLWLEEQPTSSVVFLCFGSMGGFGEEQTKEIAVALERSGHRFLWSLRSTSPVENMTASPPGEFKNLEEILPEGFLNRTAEIGKIISWAPQVAVLESPAIGAFVTHCGWNSILESLWFGVPTAAWPIYAEQQFNAFQMVEDLCLAADVRKEYRRDSLIEEPEIVTAEEIERGIECAMEQDSEMRKRVMDVRDKLHVALLDGGSSNAALRKFVQDVVENIP
ncbi:UDP-glycosyltransferase 71B1 [Cardamine amara subsp. amara]|uniref:Glycosyltransferase n=1 Tax=Cardamine amara subsp. amara TaxID=228776 RepID=A0ABD1A811_CARAN